MRMPAVWVCVAAVAGRRHVHLHFLRLLPDGVEPELLLNASRCFAAKSPLRRCFKFLCASEIDTPVGAAFESWVAYVLNFKLDWSAWDKNEV